MKEALSSCESSEWIKAMKLEINSMHDKNVWTLVKPDPNVKVIGTKWIFKKKLEDDKTLFKARLVATGYSQKPGIDYNETFFYSLLIFREKDSDPSSNMLTSII